MLCAFELRFRRWLAIATVIAFAGCAGPAFRTAHGSGAVTESTYAFWFISGEEPGPFHVDFILLLRGEQHWWEPQAAGAHTGTSGGGGNFGGSIAVDDVPVLDFRYDAETDRLTVGDTTIRRDSANLIFADRVDGTITIRTAERVDFAAVNGVEAIPDMIRAVLDARALAGPATSTR
jgi:hypothetical protein